MGPERGHIAFLNNPGLPSSAHQFDSLDCDVEG